MGGEENGEERRKTTTASSANPLAPGKQLKSASALNPKQPFFSQWTFGGNIKIKLFFTSACLLPQIHSGRSLLDLKTYKIRGLKHKPAVSRMAQILAQTRPFLFCPTQDQDSCWKKLIALFQSTFLQQHHQSSEVLNSSTESESQWELCSLHPGTAPSCLSPAILRLPWMVCSSAASHVESIIKPVPGPHYQTKCGIFYGFDQ